MLKTWFSFFVFLLFASQSSASPFFKKEILNTQIIDAYLETHERFSSKTCKPGTEPQFWELNKNLRGDGHFFPMLPNDKLDKKTISKYIPELKAKTEWIENQIEYVKKEKSFSLLIQKINALEEQLEGLLDLKQTYHEASNKLEARKTAVTSKYALLKFQVKLLDFFDQIPFLLSYGYPVDHFELRKQYDKYKNSTDVDNKRKANQVYFRRTLVQDGAQDPNHTRSDEFQRGMLDTISLHLTRNKNAIISEDMRYDLESSFSMLKSLLARGASQNIIRLQEWKERNLRSTIFYTSLVSEKIKLITEHKSVEEMTTQKTQARFELKDYNFKKQAEVYHFWREQSEVLRALFSIETILYNEVGGLDAKFGVEKKDITQIVLNRRFDSFYSSLEKSDGLFDYLDLSQEKVSLFPWLNLMFKEGEFSFTYYFIPSSVRVYCPEMTRSGKWLRRKNLKIALESLLEPRPKFNAFRYYSRHSMQGRIRMDKLWSGHEAIAERAGVLIVDDKNLKKSLALGAYEYLYSFISPSGEEFNVLNIKETIYVHSPESGSFHTWRNPHYFRYFRRSK